MLTLGKVTDLDRLLLLHWRGGHVLSHFLGGSKDTKVEALVQRLLREHQRFYNKWGTAEQWIKAAQEAVQGGTGATAAPAAGVRRVNEDAAQSLTEGVEETLTLHRMGVTEQLGMSLVTTNQLESILALVRQRVGKVDR